MTLTAHAHRDAWFLGKARELLERLPDASRDFLSRFKTTGEPPEIEHALYVLNTCSRYYSGAAPDAIAKGWAAHRVVVDASAADAILDDLVRPARVLFLSCALPFHRYWDIRAISTDFLIYFMSRGVRAGAARQTLVDDVYERWFTDSAELAARLFDEAELIATGNGPPVSFYDNDHPHAGTIAALMNDAGVSGYVTAQMAAHSPELKDRPDLLSGVRFTHTAVALHQTADGSTDPEAAQAVRQAAQQLVGAAVQWVKTLLPGEVTLIRAPDPDIHLLEECIRRTPLLKGPRRK